MVKPAKGDAYRSDAGFLNSECGDWYSNFHKKGGKAESFQNGDK